MKTSLLSATALAISSITALAYPYDDSLSDLSGNITVTGAITRTSGTVNTYNIPKSNWPRDIAFTLQGGDGGEAKANAAVGADKIADGGGGLLTYCRFDIDPTAANALRPGGEIRFVVGSRGENKSRTDTSGSGGGGGTAVLYRAPVSGASWELLAVSGGGGGGAASALVVNTYARDGDNANSGKSGTDGGGSSNTRGTNGGGGVSWSGQSGGGGGSNDAAAESQGGKAGKTSSYSGGNGGEGNGGGGWGGFGFGGGGAGWNGDKSETNGEDSAGGGGGGYSGGGAGSDNHEGGGGGSYMDTTRATIYTQTIRNGNGSTGYVSYLAVPDANNGNLSAPTVTLNGNSTITIYDFETLSDVDPGATAVDVYGNSISSSSITITDNIVAGTPGTYTASYKATDQFGRTKTITRTVITVSANKPTFDIFGNVTVDEDSGAYSKTSFITNFNANDSDQSLNDYEISVNKPQLFSTQPDINNSGKLTFTPAANAKGTATITIVAVDEPDDSNNGSSDPVTFTITINGIDDPPTNLSLSTNTAAENQTFVGLFNASDPFGNILEFTIVDGADGSLFTLGKYTGLLEFKNAPDYETPLDGNGDNIYELTVKAKGGDGSTEKTFYVTVTNVDEGITAMSLSNNTITENNDVVGTVTAVDEDGDAVTYAITGGADSASFDIDEDSGALSFISAPDFENPSDSNTNNSYTVKVTASSVSDSVEQSYQIFVTNEDEGITSMSLSNSSIAENTTTVGTVSAADEDGDTVTYAITSGTDREYFTIDADTGELSFISPPDYENPLDNDAANSYFLRITASSSGGSEEQSYTITVTDIDETTLEYFREQYGLASDGSEDTSDMSGNGISNIFYYLYGLGDPNSTTVDTTRLPAIEASGTDTVTYSFVQPIDNSSSYEIWPYYSDDLSSWTYLSPSGATTTDLGDGYQRVEITVLITETQRYYRLKAVDTTLIQ